MNFQYGFYPLPQEVLFLALAHAPNQFLTGGNRGNRVVSYSVISVASSSSTGIDIKDKIKT
jgi:hypothetical protein